MAEIPPVAQAVGHIPSGLFILTVGRGEAATGLLTSFVQQVGFDPPWRSRLPYRRIELSWI